MNKRMQWVDAIKGWAIVGVVLVHSSGAYILPFPFNKICEHGNSGVQAFFIISTFLALYSYNNNSQSIKKWYIDRLRRIVPPYYIALTVKILLYNNIAYWFGAQGKLTIGDIGSHFFLLHGFSPKYINSILGIEWYVANYVILIMIIPVIARFVKGIVKSLIFVLCTSIVCYCFIFAAQSLVMESNIAILEPYINSFGIWTQLPAISLGTLLYAIVNSEYKNIIIGKKRLAYVVLFMAAYGLMILIMDVGVRGITQESLFAIVLFGVIFSQFIYQSKFVTNKLWICLGKHSYIIYLFHYFMFDFFDIYLRKDVELNLMWWILRVIFAFATTIILSVLYNVVVKLLSREKVAMLHD